jgi:hypothetical protein
MTLFINGRGETLKTIKTLRTYTKTKKEIDEMQTIPAQPGWNVVTGQSMHATVRTIVEIYREPVLAWSIDTDMGRTTVMPITITGTISSPDIIFERPDKTFVQPGVDFWRDDGDMLIHFRDMEEQR